MLKTVIGGISGGVIVILILIFFPFQLETVQEMVQEESKHPCQKAVLEYVESERKFYLFAKNFQSKSDEEHYQKLYNEMMQEGEKAKKIYEQYDCLDKNGNAEPSWFTSEFKEELLLLYEKYS